MYRPERQAGAGSPDARGLEILQIDEPIRRRERLFQNPSLAHQGNHLLHPLEIDFAMNSPFRGAFAPGFLEISSPDEKPEGRSAR